jgi:hypothetical protein
MLLLEEIIQKPDFMSHLAHKCLDFMLEDFL